MLIKLTVTGDTSQGIQIKGASLMAESGLGQGLGGEKHMFLESEPFRVEWGPGQVPFWSPGMLKPWYQTVVASKCLRVTITNTSNAEDYSVIYLC